MGYVEVEVDSPNIGDLPMRYVVSLPPSEISEVHIDSHSLSDHIDAYFDGL